MAALLATMTCSHSLCCSLRGLHAPSLTLSCSRMPQLALLNAVAHGLSTHLQSQTVVFRHMLSRHIFALSCRHTGWSL